MTYTKYTPYFVCICFLLMSVAFAQDAFSQTRSPVAAQKRITRPMIPLDPITLQAEGVKIRLWGIKQAQTRETPLELKAIDYMEKMIGNEPVNCRIEKSRTKSALFARCAVHTNEDLGLALLQSGMVVIDRHQTYGSVFASSYEEAQNNARQKRIGVWEFVVEGQGNKLIPVWLEDYMPSLVPLALVFGPFFGLLTIALMAHQGLRNMNRRQAMEFQETREKEDALLRREKLVLASALEGELSENKVKIEAFLTIYHALMNELTAEGATPKYQKGGDLVHKHPALNRTVFEGSISKLSALDMQLASTLSKLYTHIYAEPDYITIDSKAPLQEVTGLVQNTVNATEALIPQIDYALEQLDAMMQKQLGGPEAAAKAAHAAEEQAAEKEATEKEKPKKKQEKKPKAQPPAEAKAESKPAEPAKAPPAKSDEKAAEETVLAAPAQNNS